MSTPKSRSASSKSVIFDANVSASKISGFLRNNLNRHSAAFFRTTGRIVGVITIVSTSPANESANSRPPTFAMHDNPKH